MRPSMRWEQCWWDQPCVMYPQSQPAQNVGDSLRRSQGGFFKCIIAAVLSCTALIQCASLFVRKVLPGLAESLPKALP